MPTNTYTPIGSVTLATATSEVTFTVPTGYRDLVLVANARGTITTYTSAQIRFNGTSTPYSSVAMYGTGSGQSSYTDASGFINAEQIARSNDASGLFTPVIIQVMDYSATDKHKTVLIRNSSMGGSQVVAAIAGRWASLDAITSMTLFPYSGNFESGSTFNLYGIVA